MGAEAKAVDWNVFTGTQSWNVDGNWLGGGPFPDGPGQVANFGVDNTGNLIINLNVPITVGSLNVGDTASTQTQVFQVGSGGSLIFDNSGSGATLTRGGGGTGAVTISAPMVLNDNLSVSGSSANGAMTLSGAISGAGGFTKSGTNSVTLSSGANTYTGDTTITAGTLIATGNSIPNGVGKGIVNINGGTFSYNNTTVNGISGTGTLSRAGGSLTVGTGTSTFGGILNINGGLFTKGGGGTFTLKPTSVTAAAMSNVIINDDGRDGTLRLDYGSLATPTNMIAAAAIANMRGGSLEIIGDDTLTTNQTFGNLRLDASAASNNNVTVISNGPAANLTFTSGNFQRAMANTLNFDASAGATINATTTTTNGLLNATTTAGGATHVQSAYATFNGSTWATSSGGTIFGLVDGSYSQSSSLANAAAYNATTGVASNIDVNNSPALDAGITVNSLRFNTAGANTLTLTGTNTLSGGGILVSGNVGANTTTITGAPGSKLIGKAGGGAGAGGSGASVTTAADLIVHQYNADGILDIATEIADDTAVVTGLTKAGPGTLKLSGANTYSGTTSIGAGTVLIGSTTAIPSGSGKGGVNLNATLDLGGNSITLNGLLSRNGKVTNSGAGNVTLTLGGNDLQSFLQNDSIVEDGTGGGTLAIEKIDTGTLTASSAVTYSGGTTLTAGKIVTDADSTATSGPLGTGVVTVNGGLLQLGTLSSSVNNTSLLNNTLVNSISGSGTSTATTGVSFSSNNTSNAFTIGGLSGSGDIALMNNAVTQAAIALTVGNNGSSTSYSGVLSGGGSLAKIGGGILSLSGANTYTGGTTVVTGSLELGNSERLSDTGELAVNGGTFNVGGFSETVGAVTLAGGSIVGSGGSVSGTSYALQSGSVTANLMGTGSATKTTAGTVTLAGNNTFSGNLFFINDGTLNLTGSHNTGSGAYIVGFFNGNNATVNISGDLTIGSEGVGPDYAMEIGTAGTGKVTQTAGTVTTNGSWGLIAIGDVVDGNGTYELKGGVLDVAAGDVGAIFAGPGTASFAFTGGTLKVKLFNPTDADGPFPPGDGPFLLGSGFSQGGLTQNNTDDPGSLLDVTGNDTTIYGNYNLLGGTVEVGALQTLTVSQDATLSSGSTWNLQFDSSTEEFALLSVGGDLNLNGVTLNFEDLGLGSLTDPSYVLAQASGQVLGSVVDLNTPLGYFVNISGNQLLLQQVPEPGAIILLGFGVFGIGVFRRRCQR